LTPWHSRRMEGRRKPVGNHWHSRRMRRQGNLELVEGEAERFISGESWKTIGRENRDSMFSCTATDEPQGEKEVGGKGTSQEERIPFDG